MHKPPPELPQARTRRDQHRRSVPLAVHSTAAGEAKVSLRSVRLPDPCAKLDGL